MRRRGLRCRRTRGRLDHWIGLGGRHAEKLRVEAAGGWARRKLVERLRQLKVWATHTILREKAFGLYSPVGGEGIEANDALAGDPARLGSQPYGQGWLFRVRVLRAPSISWTPPVISRSSGRPDRQSQRS